MSERYDPRELHSWQWPEGASAPFEVSPLKIVKGNPRDYYYWHWDAEEDEPSRISDLLEKEAYFYLQAWVERPSVPKDFSPENLLEVNKRYSIAELIGSGASCDVFFGWDHNLGIVIALKMVNSKRTRGQMTDWDAIQMQEAIVLAGFVNTKGIPKVYDLVVYQESSGNESYCLIMEYIDGEDLYVKPLTTLTELIAFVTQATTIMSQLHAHDVDHGDLKPHQFILTKNGHVYLVDLNVSTKVFETKHRRPGALYATPAYTPPWLYLNDNRYRLQSDTFTYALVCFELITGVLACDLPELQITAQGTSNRMQRWTGMHTMHHVYLDLRLERLGVPAQAREEIKQLFIKALNDNPESNFENIGEFGEQLAVQLHTGL